MAFDLYNPTEVHRDLRKLVAQIALGNLKDQASKYDDQEEFNETLLRRFGSDFNLFGITVPEESGGAGLDTLALVIIHEELSRFDPAFTLSYLAHEVLFINNLFHSAQEYLKKKYLPPMISGEHIGAMCMSEPNSGTDVLGMKTYAEKKGEYYILNGTKQWITNADVAQAFIVYAKLDKDDPRSITSFVVEKNMGVKIGKKEKKMGMKQSPTSQVIFEDTQIPTKNLIGKERNALTHMMRNLEVERVVLGAQSLGIGRRAIDEMTNYAINVRQSFGKPLISFGQIQQMIAESYSRYCASRALTYDTASRVNPNSRESLSAAAAKLSATQMGEYVARCAIQVFGGYGYTREYPVEKLLRDAILLSIGGGTNEAMQKNIVKDLVIAKSAIKE